MTAPSMAVAWRSSPSSLIGGASTAANTAAASTSSFAGTFRQPLATPAGRKHRRLARPRPGYRHQDRNHPSSREKPMTDHQAAVSGLAPVPLARLEPDAIGVAQDTVIGMATSGPAVSVGLTLAALAAATAYAG